jgi:hypothetical protein
MINSFSNPKKGHPFVILHFERNSVVLNTVIVFKEQDTFYGQRRVGTVKRQGYAMICNLT